MVRREGTRFGVATGQSLRKPVRSQGHIHAAQNIVVKTTTDVKLKRAEGQANALIKNHLQSRQLNAKGFVDETVLAFSLNKNRRWEIMDTLKQGVGHSCSRGNRIVITEHHIGIGGSGEDNCIAAYDSMSEAVRRSPRKTYAKAADLVAMETESEEQTTLENEEFGQKNRKRRRRKKVKTDKDGVQPDAFTVKVEYGINIAAPRQTRHTFIKRDVNRGFFNEDDDVVLPSSRKGTKKRNKKPARDLWDDIQSEVTLDVDEDYIEDHDDDLLADEYLGWKEMGTVRSKVTNALGMFVVNVPVNGQSRKSKSKKRGGPANGSAARFKDHIFTIEEPYTVMTESKSGSVEDDFMLESNVREVKVLTEVSVLPETLRGNFGNNYREALCSPRRFAVDISANIIDELERNGGNRAAERLLQTGYHAFCVFGLMPQPRFGRVVEMNVQVVGEVFNGSDVLKSLAYLPEAADVVDVVKNISECAASRPESGFLYEETPSYSSRFKMMPGYSLDTVQSSLQWRCEIQTLQQLSQELLEDTTNARQQESKNGVVVPESWKDYGRCCGICYEDLCEKCPGTSLLACNHWFCDDCWKGYLVARVAHGNPDITCPELSCDSPVDTVSLMSLLPTKLFSRHWQQKINTAVIGQDHLLWCPHAACGRLANLGGSDPNGAVETITVHCECGSLWCSKCKLEAHWPATCGQAATYRKEMLPYLEYKVVPDIIVDQVRTKRCPQCKYPFEKWLGCPMMTCICKCHFCWDCGREWSKHEKCPGNSAQYEVFEFDYIPMKHVYELAIVHHKRRSKRRFGRRHRISQELANIVAVALYHQGDNKDDTAAAPFSSVVPYVPKVYTFARMNGEEEGRLLIMELREQMRKAADFLVEADFILEYLEVLLGSTPGSKKKRALVEKKSTLAFICQQLDDILTMRVEFDKLSCVERVSTLYERGKSCLIWLAKAAADVNSQMTATKETESKTS